MSIMICEKTLKEISSAARQAAVQAAWKQWASLGASALSASGGRASSIVDPEALLLLSLQVYPAERRLADFIAWWAGVGSELLSVQRTKTLLRGFPPPVQDRLEEFAYLAMQAGDKRWRRHAAGQAPGFTARGRKGTERPRLIEAPALMLRLRAGFGVSAKADVLAYLLGTGGNRGTVHAIAEAVGYTGATVRKAANDMALAGLVQEAGGHPVGYLAHVRPWAELLELRGPPGLQSHRKVPAWRYWASVFTFLAQVDHWARETEREEGSAYLRSSEARDLFEAHRHAFVRNRIQVPNPERQRGAAYLEGFRETVEVLADWMAEHL